jgi:hypothetical protein
MNHTKSRKIIVKLLTTIALSISFISVSLAEGIPLIDGNLWLESSIDNKHSYLIGVSNLLAIEYGYQKASKKPVTDDQSIISRFYGDVDDLSLDETTKRIDQWYQKHPDELNKAVLDVIWVDMVETK